MAQSSARDTTEDARSIFLKPLQLLAQSFILCLDVSTLMPRMLLSTLAHDTPHGKTELAADLKESKRDR